MWSDCFVVVMKYIAGRMGCVVDRGEGKIDRVKCIPYIYSYLVVNILISIPLVGGGIVVRKWIIRCMQCTRIVFFD